MPLTLTEIQSEAEAHLNAVGTLSSTTSYMRGLLKMAYNLGRLDRTQEVLNDQLYRTREAVAAAANDAPIAGEARADLPTTPAFD